MNSTQSAAATTASGTVSSCLTDVTASTASFRLSRCWTFSAVIDVDARVEEFLHVFPALLGVPAARYARMGEPVHHGRLRMPGQQRINVQLGDVVPR